MSDEEESTSEKASLLKCGQCSLSQGEKGIEEVPLKEALAGK